MISFPNCKINLGLNVVEKRPDGFHSLQTVFYPINWCDALEVIENKSVKAIELSTSGLAVQGKTEENIIYRAWKLISSFASLPPLSIHLHKNIPMGAGLGGGSSDAAFFINLLDRKFGLNLTHEQKHSIASELGSDCAFFLENKPVFAQGRGNEFSPVKIDLGAYHILVVYPGVHSNTKEAFEGLTPKTPQHNLKLIVEETNIREWKHLLTNDFDATIMKKYPSISNLKNTLYAMGALYAAMSGSGSAVYGIFEKKPILDFSAEYRWHLQLPKY
jgi:4-diphosphocytidyl-2-C-methyl-D-erythritol kinase